MKSRRIGSLDASLVGLGCNNFGWRVDEAGTARVVDAALEAGITFLDTADMYGGSKSETFLGNVLHGRRERVVLATKFGNPVGDEKGGAKGAYVRRACEASLKRLRTDRIDLYQLHRPDPETPIGETLEALGALVREGKVREIGCSNFTVAQLDEAKRAAKAGAARFVSVQNEYSLLHRDPEADVLPWCERESVAFLPYFPLASGALTGKYRKGEAAPENTRLGATPGLAERYLPKIDVVEKLRSVAETRGHTLLELAFAWLAAHRAVASVIAGATSPEQVRANAKAVAWELTEDEVREVDRLAR